MMAAGSVLRVIDAAANRAREGLRVAEDWARLAVGDGELASGLRDARHNLVAAVGKVAPLEALLAARDTPGDPGACPEAFKPAERASERAVVVSAFKRAEEGLRTLAEFAKPLAPQASADFERLRYRLYEIEKRLLLDGADRARLKGAGLMAVVGCADDARRAIVKEADVIEITLAGDDRAACALARELTGIARAGGALALVRSRADIARAAGADGVVLGPKDICVSDARAVLGPAAVIGRICRDSADIPAAADDGASLVILPSDAVIAQGETPALPIAMDAPAGGPRPAPPLIARINARDR